MALGLNRIWVRFGLWITAAVLLAIAALATGVLAFSEGYPDLAVFEGSQPSRFQ